MALFPYSDCQLAYILRRSTERDVHLFDLRLSMERREQLFMDAMTKPIAKDGSSVLNKVEVGCSDDMQFAVPAG